MKNSALIRSFYLITVTILAGTAVLAQQDNSAEGRLRAANAQVLRLRAQMYTAGAGEQGSIRSQAAQALAQRQAQLESLMKTNPAAAAALAFPSDVLTDLAGAFPQSAANLEERGTWQGLLEIGRAHV